MPMMIFLDFGVHFVVVAVALLSLRCSLKLVVHYYCGWKTFRVSVFDYAVFEKGVESLEAEEVDPLIDSSCSYSDLHGRYPAILVPFVFK